MICVLENFSKATYVYVPNASTITDRHRSTKLKFIVFIDWLH